METNDNGVFRHDEADVTMISYVLEAACCGKEVIRVLSDDTDVFILLVYWVYRSALQCKVQMERWNGTVLDINATCANLGPKCLELLGMHALSGCDTTSYPYGKGKVTALSTLLAGQFPGLVDVLGEVGAKQEELMEAVMPFFVALYGQTPGTSMEYARFNLFTKRKKPPKVMSLPPTSPNLLHHILRAHLQVMLWKAADNVAPPDESADITTFGWEYQDGIPTPVLSKADPAPPVLLDVIQCHCKATKKKCGTEACGCRKEHMSCTVYCNCSGDVACFNPYTKIPDEENDNAGGEPIEEQEDMEEDDYGEAVDIDDEDGDSLDDAADDCASLDDEWRT